MFMFPGRQRRPMPPYPPFRLNRPPFQGQQIPSKPNLLAQFRDSEGRFDFDKISKTAQQINKLYGQVSPMITKFIKR